MSSATQNETPMFVNARRRRRSRFGTPARASVGGFTPRREPPVWNQWSAVGFVYQFSVSNCLPPGRRLSRRVRRTSSRPSGATTSYSSVPSVNARQTTTHARPVNQSSRWDAAASQNAAGQKVSPFVWGSKPQLTTGLSVVQEMVMVKTWEKVGWEESGRKKVGLGTTGRSRR